MCVLFMEYCVCTEVESWSHMIVVGIIINQYCWCVFNYFFLLFLFSCSCKVKEATELEQAQRVTEEKKQVMHEELVRKATAKMVYSNTIYGMEL